jgi:exosortase/archaeosortase family protein
MAAMPLPESSPTSHPALQRWWGTSGWIVIGLALACWPVLLWWGRRVVDDSDEPLGVLALVCGLAFVWQARHRLGTSALALASALGLILIGRMMAGWLPMLLQGLFLVLALTISLRLWRLPGVVSLLSLALPWVATLQFVLGYPLRVIVAMGAEAVLRLLGLTVTREGTDLWYQGVAVGVDAPCSGIRMLWFLLFAAGFLAARFRLRWGLAISLHVIAGSLALLANGVRATVLFFPESGLVEWPHWTHEATGVLVFAPCLAWLLWLAQRRSRASAQLGTLSAPPLKGPLCMGFLAACVLIAASWFFRSADSSAISAESSPFEWPTSFRDQSLEPLPLSVREEHFAAGFPGQLARFRCGDGELIFRRVTRATRMLHSAQDCFTAAGFTMQRLSPNTIANDGIWQVWEAKRGDEPALIVCEHIRSAEGDLFTDVSAWYWQALRHPEKGPWLAITWVRYAREVAAAKTGHLD